MLFTSTFSSHIPQTKGGSSKTDIYPPSMVQCARISKEIDRMLITPSSLLTPLRLKVRLNLELSSNLLQQCKADFNVLSDTLPLFLLIFSKIIRAILFLTTSSLPDVHLQQQRPFSGGRTCSSPLAWPRQVGLPRPITYKYYTGSSRKNVKSNTVCTGINFHKSSQLI